MDWNKRVFRRMSCAFLMAAAMTGCAGQGTATSEKSSQQPQAQAPEPALPIIDSKNWKEAAQAGIERYRKRDAAVTVVDGAGKPVADATLELVETKKAFPFGAAISGGIVNNPQWQAFFKSHFNYAVFENETKWRSNEAQQGQVNFRQADSLVAWCKANGIPMRGHCIYWEDPKNGPPQWLNRLDADGLKQALEKRMVDFTTHFKGDFTDWDVNNEMMHGTYFIDKAGKDIRVWMYKRAKEIDPSVRLVVNDFNVLSVDQNFKEVQTAEFVAEIKDLMARGAPVDAVGIQGHIWYEDILAHPEVIRQRLEMVASLGLPMWITEFDVADADAKVRADKLELVYRTAFSEPLMQGLVMWDPAGGSWRGANAVLFGRDYTANEEGKRFESLLAEWTTKASLQTDAKGATHFRGFHGTYSATITVPGKPPVMREFKLEPGKGAQTVSIEI